MGITNIVFWASLAALALLVLIHYSRARKFAWLALWLVLLAAAGAAYFYTFQAPSLTGKAEQPNQLAFIVVLYVFMFLGIICHFFYAWLSKPKSGRDPFDWGSLLAPVFASPLVFVPLLGAFQSADVDLARLTMPKVMIFFVAFQNGFFWKEVVDNRAKEQQK